MWWPNGLGAQPLYTFRARSIVKGRTTDEKTTRTGLRTLRLDRERDQNGESFMFVINGVPVFGKRRKLDPLTTSRRASLKTNIASCSSPCATAT